MQFGKAYFDKSIICLTLFYINKFYKFNINSKYVKNEKGTH